jgi:hypothetical protein
MIYEYTDAYPFIFIYLYIPTNNALSESLGSSFQEITAFVINTIALRGGRRLVYYQEGISRSAMAVSTCLIMN